MDDGPKARRVDEHFMGTPDGVMAPVDDLMDEIRSADRAKEKDTDHNIIASAILGVDIREVYSPERVNDVAKRHGLAAGSPLDLTNGSFLHHQSTDGRLGRTSRPRTRTCPFRSPPYAVFSLRKESNTRSQNREGWIDEFSRRRVEAIEHIDFCCTMYEYQVRRGRHFLHEHPWTSSSWKLPGIQSLLRNPVVTASKITCANSE